VALEQVNFPSVPDELVRRYRSEGLWTDQTLGMLLHRSLSNHPDSTIRIWSATRPRQSTFAELLDLGGRMAAGLERLGIRQGDTVVVQLPNWLESVAAFVGLSMAGVILVPVVQYYGPKELEFILRQSRAKAFLTVERFGARQHLAELEGFRSTLSDLEHVVVVDGSTPGWASSFADLIDGDALGAPRRLDPALPAAVAYTSGTTSDPKGVVLPHRALVCEVTHHMHLLMRPDPPQLMAAPISHVTGMLGGMLLPAFRGRPIHLMDVWDPAVALRAVLEHGVTSGSGAPVFIQSMLDHVDCTPEHVAAIDHCNLGGAPVPEAYARRLEAMGIKTLRSYGSTEQPTISSGRPDNPVDKRNATDGLPMPGVEVRIIDEDGRDLPRGAPGQIITRGPDRMLGYTDPALTAAAVDADWWFSTGDVGVLDADGYLTITDRTKDIIIRGGANISAAEIEELMMKMPGIAEVAVVAAPDARMGEHACAFVRMRPGQSSPQLGDVQTHLRAEGLARPKWPEEVLEIAEFPRTPAGKIKKFVLRDQLRDR
jgi:acyl-CoA synthetase (AMP-forming)/AMP-acid ligase II